MCLYPKIIKNPRYTETKKNGGVIPPIHDKRVLYVPIGCQECGECRKQKIRMWSSRLIEDIRHNTNGRFVTLTFNEESLTELRAEILLELSNKAEGIVKKYKLKCEKENRNYKLSEYELNNAVATLAVRRFTERWRKKYGKTIRHFLITEIGHTGTERIHLHGIVWAGKDETIVEDMNEVEKIWHYGYVWKYKRYHGKAYNNVNGKAINYMGKYIMKVDQDHKGYKSVILCSKGIGEGYIKTKRAEANKYKGEETDDTYRRDGRPANMPIYYRNKLYTDDEKEKLWIIKLNKEERWINKTKIDVSKGYDDYYKLLKIAQDKNIKMGYGSDKEWNQERYDNKRKVLKNESSNEIKKYYTIEWIKQQKVAPQG